MIVNLNGKNIKIAEIKNIQGELHLNTPAFIEDISGKKIRTSDVKKISYNPETKSLSILTASRSVYTNDQKILELTRKVERQEIDNFQKYRDSIKEGVNSHTINKVDIGSIKLGESVDIVNIKGEKITTAPVDSLLTCDDMVMMTTKDGEFYSTEIDSVERNLQKKYRDFQIPESQNAQELADALNKTFGLKRERDEIEKIDSQDVIEFDR